MSKTGLPEVLETAMEMLERQCQRLDCQKRSCRQRKCWIGNVKDWTAGSAVAGKGIAEKAVSKTGLPEVLVSAKEMLDRQFQRLDCRKRSLRQRKCWIDNVKDWIAGSTGDGLPWKKLEELIC